MRNTGPGSLTINAVINRAGGNCEHCRNVCSGIRGVHWHIHHRRPRGMGGSRDPHTNEASNLLLLCAGCHRSIESYRAEAISNGWLVPQGTDPATVAVLITRDRWCYLSREGSYEAAPEPEIAHA